MPITYREAGPDGVFHEKSMSYGEYMSGPENVNHRARKFRPEVISRVKGLLSLEVPTSRIADHFKISTSALGEIKRGKRYKEIPIATPTNELRELATALRGKSV